MSTNTTTGPMRERDTPVGLVWLVALLIGVLGLTTAFTGYLFRSVSRPALPIRAAAAPRPFAVLLVRGADLVELQGGRSQRLATLPADLRRGLRPTDPAAGGSDPLIVSVGTAGDRLWLLPLPGGAWHQVALPRILGGWRYLASRWTANGGMAAILAAGPQTRAVLAVVRFDGHGALLQTTRLSLPGSRPGSVPEVASLSSDGRQVALAQRLGGSGGFQPQVIVRLQHLYAAEASIAYRYLGADLPSAVLWSPDDGTVAIAAPDVGMAIQKASGRPVRQVRAGELPGAFSPGIARFCYLIDGARGWQFQVLYLHSESVRAVGSPMSAKPGWAGWTPDGRAILYTLGDRLWVLDPEIGIARPAGTASGTPIAVEGRG